MPQPVFLASVHGGSLFATNSPKYDLYLRSLEGQEVEVIVRKVRKRRSVRENDYYHGVVVKMIADELGYEEPMDVHMELRRKFLPMDDTGPLMKSRSTTSLSTVEMEDYLSRIRVWAATFLGLMIPLPNEVL